MENISSIELALGLQTRLRSETRTSLRHCGDRIQYLRYPEIGLGAIEQHHYSPSGGATSFLLTCCAHFAILLRLPMLPTAFK